MCVFKMILKLFQTFQNPDSAKNLDPDPNPIYFQRRGAQGVLADHDGQLLLSGSAHNNN